MYAVTDIETTGGSPQNEKITEIAIILHDGKSIIKEYSTLVNPEKHIPSFITALTGINDEMVADAPKFYEIAKDIVEITENHIFVAHNVNFDYRFIKNEFKSLGYNFAREQLCTLKLSRKLLPGFRSYSLGNICASLGIQVHNRHRASGDALATTRLLELLLEKSEAQGRPDIISSALAFNSKNLHPSLDISRIDSLPEETGVYYFHNDRNQVIYIGKSKNIRKRVLNHLGNTSSRRSLEMAVNIAAIDYELTGSELIALLVESSEIKKHMPFYNRAQRRIILHYGLFSWKDSQGYLNLSVDRTSNRINDTPATCFSNLAEARAALSRLTERNWLCQKLCGLYQTEGACFHYGIRQCNGACIGKEPPGIYNNRVTKALSTYYYESRNFLIIDRGRSSGERSVIQIENGKYMGFGFIDVEESYVHLDNILDRIKIYEDNKDIQQIIRSYLNRTDVEKIIRY
jgi:DNA polymerase-3 subunit epsilon